MKNEPKRQLWYLSIYMLIFNILENLHHSISPSEISLIKNTGLFEHFDQKQFDQVIHSARLVKYPRETLIFKEGDLADSLYILVDGSVRVFSYDIQGKKVPLARLIKGNYFGEQGIIGQVRKTRTASIETIENITLIKIPAKAIITLWQENTNFIKKLKKIGYDQAIHALISSIDVYRELFPSIGINEKQSITEFQKGQVIFNYGDKPDNVHLILQGKVEVIIPGKDAKKSRHLILHKGHIFGELGVLENKPRQATIIAHNDVRLLTIDGEHFKRIHNQNPQLKNMLSKLKQTYQLHMETEGIVEQYIGDSQEVGATITNIFKMDDGRTIVSMRTLNREIFTMSNTSATGGITYKYIKDEQNFTILKVANSHLVGIESCGDWDELPTACFLMLSDETIDNATLEKFIVTRKLARISPAVAEEIICTCMSIAKKQLQELIDNGMRDFDLLSKETGASTVCGSCRSKILEMLGDNPWLTANLTVSSKHNSYINSYLIKPKNTQFKKFIPGQYIIVQAKIHDKWIERAYTISGTQDDALRISVKKEAKGLLTKWLFEEAPELIEVNVTNPQGFFTLNKDLKNPVLCFAGGIGITPFITYMKDLTENHLDKRMHLLYCALTKNDFIFTNEFSEITQANPSITVTYRGTNEHGLITEKEITDIVKSFQEPDIYICGPEGFVNLISSALKDIRYDQNKIHTEKFVFAGSSNPE